MSNENVATLKKDKTAPKLRVKIKRLHGVARWSWNAGDNEVCGICRNAYEGVAPGALHPGDECPVVWGRCGHAFHLQCVSTWLSGGRSTSCPICRRDWEFGANENDNEGDGEGETGNEDTGADDTGEGGEE
eukprot:CAMPEP_0194373700 /NCGR_PEP_ID=MMETSP0174-20130528/22175_1 /TAXON_ID=216777 /ORGANISM="Proboscia alata, Strain PI-D3" /LENGTH=130 /DNA_ID=CAMNT_0039152947 /DNA_START=216 /DNA_END=605 /DNA_ORIENTATION=+